MYMTKGAETIKFICSSFLTFAMIMRKTGKGRNKQSGLVKLKQKKSTLAMLWLVLIIQLNKKQNISNLADYSLYVTFKYVNWTVHINVFHQ